MMEVVSGAGIAVISIPTIVIIISNIRDFIGRLLKKDICATWDEEKELRRLKKLIKKSRAYSVIRNEILQRTEDNIDSFKRKVEPDSRVKVIRESYGNINCSKDEVKDIYSFADNGISIGDVRALEQAIIEDIEACLRRENFGYTFTVYVRPEYDVIYYELKKENPSYAE